LSDNWFQIVGLLFFGINYDRISPVKKIFTHPFVLSLLIILGLILFNNLGWLNPIKNIFYSLIIPEEKIFYQVSGQINKAINFISSINQLDRENERLRQENQGLLEQIVQLQEVSRENEFLKKQIGLSEPEPKELVLANIVGQDSSNLRRYFLINKGTKHGVKEKAAVITAGNLLVGRVTEAADSFAKVQLVIDSSSRVNALIQESGITGLVKGEQGNLIIDLLPQSEIIEEEQTVVTSGLAGEFPSGLLIGRVEKIISSDVQISQMARIRPVVDFNNLSRVFVIR